MCFLLLFTHWADVFLYAYLCSHGLAVKSRGMGTDGSENPKERIEEKPEGVRLSRVIRMKDDSAEPAL